MPELHRALSYRDPGEVVVCYRRDKMNIFVYSVVTFLSTVALKLFHGFVTIVTA